MQNTLGKILILTGILITVIGIVVYFKDSIPAVKHLGKLPGDIVIKKENFVLYFPLGTSILISIILTLLFFLFNKIRQ